MKHKAQIVIVLLMISSQGFALDFGPLGDALKKAGDKLGSEASNVWEKAEPDVQQVINEAARVINDLVDAHSEQTVQEEPVQ